MANCEGLFLVLVVVISSCVGDDMIEFNSPPTTVKAKENNTVLLPCYLNTLSNDAAYAKSVRWYKNEDLIADSANESMALPDRHILWENGSLEILYVQPEETGEYICEIERPEPWGPVRQKHAIEVMHPPSVEPFPPNGFLQVKLGEEVKISCKGEGIPYPIITWTVKGEEMKLINHREILKFTASDRQMAGVYECIASNGVGEPAKASIELNIIYPPEMMTTRSWIHTAPGHRVQIDCKVSADPQATITWLKGEVPVHLDTRVVPMVDGDKNTLLIRNVQRSDFGIYTCRAINELGQGEITIQLSGVPNPGVFKRTEDKNTNSKTSYTLIWEVDSYTPIIEYNLWFRPYKARTTHPPNWTKLTIPTEHSSGPVYSKSYTIRGLKERTVYEALLVSRNRYGWSKPSPILRFATAGAELNEEMITTVQVNLQKNVYALQTSTSTKSCCMGMYIFFMFNVIKLFV
ncbi:limbic system-associated membrane protein-like [Diorhabda sublineata]|uniref:limbic system-associated membrane protein-like n=1 Tax=Diorhabda sublineata TaxID=1163346 RepID=UPI0024E1282B|nr:limbic system-associated membrane protein-like [Diorhabda sublineata]